MDFSTMTLTPDRTPQNPEERDPRPGSSDAAAGSDASSSSSAGGRPSLFDQLKDANLDLTGHPLAEKFESLAAVPTDVPGDEPTSSLDSDEVEKLFTVMRRLRDEGVAIVFVSHFLDQVYEIADRMTILRNGRLVEERMVGELADGYRYDNRLAIRVTFRGGKIAHLYEYYGQFAHAELLRHLGL